MDPLKQVGNTIATPSDYIVSSSQIISFIFDEHPNEPEVTPAPELFINDVLGTMLTDEILSNDVLNDMANIEIPNRYELPPRTQGEYHQRDMILNLRHKDRDIR